MPFFRKVHQLTCSSEQCPTACNIAHVWMFRRFAIEPLDPLLAQCQPVNVAPVLLRVSMADALCLFYAQARAPTQVCCYHYRWYWKYHWCEKWIAIMTLKLKLIRWWRWSLCHASYQQHCIQKYVHQPNHEPDHKPFCRLNSHVLALCFDWRALVSIQCARCRQPESQDWWWVATPSPLF